MKELLTAKSQKDKLTLFALIEEAMIQELQQIIKSAHAAHGGATHEDAVAKSKYDTHGLELSYLAGSQYERARLLEADIAAFRKFYQQLPEGDGTIDQGSLVEIEKANSSVGRTLLICPYGAGVTVIWCGHEVTVVSPDSRLGMELLDQEINDEIVVNSKEKNPWLVKSVF